MTQINAKKQKISNKVIYSTIIKKDIHCPICKNDKTTLLYAVTANEAAQHFVLKEIDVKRNIKLADHINKLWKNETCEIIKCDSIMIDIYHKKI